MYEGTEETGGEDEESYSESVAETNKENVKGSLSKELEINQQYSLEVDKNEAVTKLYKYSSNSHSKKAVIDNFPMLWLNLTMKIKDLKWFLKWWIIWSKQKFG